MSHLVMQCDAAMLHICSRLGGCVRALRGVDKGWILQRIHGGRAPLEPSDAIEDVARARVRDSRTYLAK